MKLQKEYQRFSLDIEETLRFIEWLDHSAPDVGEPTVQWEQPSYRIVMGTFDPLSIEGSLGSGGRFNVGGAQVNRHFPAYSMQGMLYAASSRTCAYEETGDFLGAHSLFSLFPQRTLHLWDLDTLLNSFSYPDLRATINATPLDAVWVYQKVPKVSQVLGAFFRAQGGDGILYPSTKYPNGKILAFFAKDQKAMFHTFKMEQLLPNPTF